MEQWLATMQWFSTVFSLSMARKAYLDSPNITSMLLENCIAKSSCCLRRFWLIAMSFKSSTKNKWFRVVQRLPEGQFGTLLISLIKTTIDLLNEWTTILKDCPLGKYLEDSELCFIGCLLHYWLGEGLLTIFASKFHQLILQVVALLLFLGKSEAIHVVYYRMPFGNLNWPWQQIFCILLPCLVSFY